MLEQPLEDLLTRLDRERLEADRLYNDALTAVNLAIQTVSPLPSPPPAADPTVLERLNREWDLLAKGFPTASFSGWRRRLADFVIHLVAPALERQRQFNAAVVEHLNRNAAAAAATPEAIAAVIGALRAALEGLCRFQSLLVQYLMTITAYVDTRDRRLGAEGIAEQLRFVDQRLFALGQEMDRWRAGGGSARLATGPVSVPDPAPSVSGAPAPGAPDHVDLRGDDAFAAPVASMTYVGFEDRFRGEAGDIRRRVEDYLPLFASARDIVDIGCGRGELLDVLTGRGIPARGVDSNQAMVDICRARGHEVERADALSFLQQQPPSSLGGLVAIQVVEHFTPAYLNAFLAAAHAAMRPGAPLVLETINPACWSAFFETFIRDLTHQRPLHPDTLQYLVQASGFAHAAVQYRQPVRESDRLARVVTPSADPVLGDAIAAVNDHADKLNARLFSSFDYVVVARR